MVRSGQSNEGKPATDRPEGTPAHAGDPVGDPVGETVGGRGGLGHRGLPGEGETLGKSWSDASYTWEDGQAPKRGRQHRSVA